VNGPSPDLQVRRSTSALAADCDLNIRGLLHDLGHQMMTLSLLADSVRDDGALSSAARQRMEIVKQEMFRIEQLVAEFMSPDAATARAEMVDIREIAVEAAQLAGLAYDTSVTVEPGGPAVISISTSLLRRVLRNLLDNAVRAAGPGGQVSIRIEQKPETVVEIADTGPGFGRAPSGAAGLGLTVVRELLHAAGGRLDIATEPAGGARVRVTFSPDPQDNEQPPVLADRAQSVGQGLGPSLESKATATVT
jgi:signal transduction histidine kinase